MMKNAKSKIGDQNTSSAKSSASLNGRVTGTPRRNWVCLAALLGCGAIIGGSIAFAQSNWFKASPAPAGVEKIAPPEEKQRSDLDPDCCNTNENPLNEPAPSKLVLPSSVVVGIHEAKAPGNAPDGMVWVPGGVFQRGSDSKSHRDARPWHFVEVDGFWMDASPVTNEQFDKFVKATGYVTIAEIPPRAEDFPDAPKENLVAGSVVFSPPKSAVPLDNHFRWWNYVKGANWRHPEGPSSDLAGREKHPVVHVAYDDALAYCNSVGKRLPTEAEFEFAARGGLDKNRYAWGSELKSNGKWMANIWQGRFPYENTLDDGYRTTSPIGAFPANGFGLSDMAGNVWQWCADWYRPDYYPTLADKAQPVQNPLGPADSIDPAEPGIAKRVMRGGSYLCTDQYCTAYEAGARGKGAPDTGTSHVGFRCVKPVR